MGHHPHTLQPFQKFRDGYIFYSLGGLTFGDYFKKDSFGALFRKTKNGIIIKFEDNNVEFIGTLEKKANTIVLRRFNYFKWSRRKMKCFYLSQKSSFIKMLILTKENMIDPTFEYFFGYYNKPIKRLFQFSNIVKIKRLISRFQNQKIKKI